ncbi:hypothetical protein BDZ89DRAFT_1037642 [Hymenopellis radicata]|nr:hypothetical protein BDZ89DRAFT_1037642 [Hymenopellis radicata]
MHCLMVMKMHIESSEMKDGWGSSLQNGCQYVMTGWNLQWKQPEGLENDIIQLAKICPSHTSWREYNVALKAILIWAQSPNPEIPLFPWPHSLQNFSATAAFHKYSVVDWTARQFSSPEVQECLEASLETLHTILENAESVEGVLVPDLEKQMDVGAALLAESQISASDTA